MGCPRMTSQMLVLFDPCHHILYILPYTRVTKSWQHLWTSKEVRFWIVSISNIIKFLKLKSRIESYFFIEIFSYSGDGHFFTVGWQNPIHIWFSFVDPSCHFLLARNWSSKQFIDRDLGLDKLSTLSILITVGNIIYNTFKIHFWNFYLDAFSK